MPPSLSGKASRGTLQLLYFRSRCLISLFFTFVFIEVNLTDVNYDFLLFRIRISVF